MLITAKITQLAINTALPLWSKQTPWKRLSSSLALTIGMGLCLPTYAQQVVADINEGTPIVVEGSFHLNSQRKRAELE